MAEPTHELQFAREVSATLTHWELRIVRLHHDTSTTYFIGGPPGQFKHGTKNQSGKRMDDIFIATDHICYLTEAQVDTVADVARSTTVVNEPLAVIKNARGKHWSCQNWTTAVVSELEGKGIVPLGTAEKLRGKIGDKEFEKDAIWHLSDL